MYAVVGSRAALHHRVIPNRKPKDWDIISNKEGFYNFLRDNNFTSEKIQKTKKGLVCFTTCGNIVEAELSENCDNISDILDAIISSSGDRSYASPEWLMFFKMSHRYKKDSPHFWKTRLDIEHMRKRGVKFPKGFEDVFKEREKLTYENKLPNLNQGSDTFFRKEEEFYVYDHDSIHRAVAVGDVPAYTLYVKEGAEVMTSSEKFYSQDEKVRLLGVYEESCVLALERSQIPFDFKPRPEDSFKMALSKVCTSITGGWFREYSWENCIKVMNLYNILGKDDYVNKFKKGYEEGIILPFKRRN